MKKCKLEKDPSDSQRMRGKEIDIEKDFVLLLIIRCDLILICLVKEQSSPLIINEKCSIRT
jgi:hypothetical protein